MSALCVSVTKPGQLPFLQQHVDREIVASLGGSSESRHHARLWAAIIMSFLLLWDSQHLTLKM
jgi:hypothetical protein